MSKFMGKVVRDHFKCASDEYATRKGYVHPEFDPIIIEFIRDNAKGCPKILEIGGGSGYMLDLIARELENCELYNVEIVPEVYRNQVNEKIMLVGADALNLPFRANTFDFVLAKNLLHHLVGNCRSVKMKNVQRAVNEMCRVTKNNRYIIILEQFNRYRLCSTIIFYLTLMFSYLGVSIKRFGLNKYVVVNFLTPKELTNIVEKCGKIIFKSESKVPVPLILKVSLLMSRVGRMLIIVKVHKKV